MLIINHTILITIHLDCTFPISLAEFGFGELHSFFLISMGEFLDLINKAKNTNIGNDNLDNVSNTAPGDTEEDDFNDGDDTCDKLGFLELRKRESKIYD